MNPTAEQPGSANWKEMGKDALAKLRSLMSTRVDKKAEDAKVFEDWLGERDGLYKELQLLGKINFASFGRIADLLTDHLKNADEVIKATVEVYRMGLSQKGPLDENEWASLTKKWISEHESGQK